MFQKDENGDIVLQIHGKSFNFENGKEYKELVIYMTDPTETGRQLISSDDLSINPSLGDEDRKVCEKFARFILSFEGSRIELIQQMSKKQESNT